MSLLLEALKKAELAKQAAKEMPPAADDNAPFTRDQLPDITQEMEIHSEDMRLAESEPAPKRAEKAVLELAPEEPPRVAPAMRTAPAETDYSPMSETAQQKQAQQLFEAKELDVNPRRPFYITIGALGLFALGTVGYFWYQLQPRSAFAPLPPSKQAAPPPLAAAPAAPAAAAPATATVAPPMGTQPAAPAAGGAAPRTASLPAPVPVPAATPAAPRGPVFARQGAPAGAAAPQRRAAPRESDIRITPTRVQSDPVLEDAFAAFNAGDLAGAREAYQQALRANPESRDALLGLAAVETQAKRHDAAEAYYARLLDLDPRDAHAQAGLIGLRGQVDPLAAESRLKSMIASQPGVSVLHFALGNQFAAQERWAEAQQAYFQAYTSDPEHPDFACNLAISLDRMHQTAPALEYYRRALALAANRPVSFDKAQISKRVSQLER